uniref:NB-ARC domain-containing protein n=1 Tax=Oryza brachyantha TaxID=4533 RepID=J3N143_ORYBR
MAEGVVGIIILKLGLALATDTGRVGRNCLCHEASALAGIFRQIRDMKEELESMQSFLQGAERFKDTDNTTANFIKKIRYLAFEIEDVVDEFTSKMKVKHGGFALKVKQRICHIKTWHRLAFKLQGVKLKLENVDRRKVRYDMTRLAKSAGLSDVNCRSTDQTSYFPTEEDLIGIDENKKLMMDWLRCDSQLQSVITTVCGMGGVGKTTLVAHVYNSVKVDFDSAAWITVSKAYQVEDLLRQIIKGFNSNDLKSELRVDIVDMEKRTLVEIIRDYLKYRRFLLVLDDVWGVDMWFKIREAFPANSIGRFIITSRVHDIALIATGNHKIDLKPLEEHHSWELFCKEAFWKNEDRICPELQYLAQRFVDKCNGLPIAIACIGRLLSCKSPCHTEWENLYKELELQLRNNSILDVNIVLKLSLDDLPYILKNCFLHCTIFPEDYLIKRKRLIRHWVASGFIAETEHKTMEEVAEGYLYELVNRSPLQVVERNESGRVRSCRMHDIIRILALTKSNEESFCHVYDGSGTTKHSTRRLSIQCADIEKLTVSVSSEVHLRAIYAFSEGLTSDALKFFLKSFNLLSTLDLQGAQIRKLPKELFNLFNLHFLCLRDTLVDDLPEAVGRLQKLEVLDTFNARLVSLPQSVANLSKLRYLYVATDPRKGTKGFSPWIGIQVPNDIRNLKCLQALQLVEASSETLCHLGALTELRTFAITKVRREQCSELCNAVMNMNHLTSLAIMAINVNETLELDALHLPPTLSKLELGGKLDKESLPRIFSSFSGLDNLTLLTLALSKLDEDSFSCLFLLNGLRGIWLDKAYEGKKLHSGMSLPSLRLLAISDAPELSDVVIEQTALQNLTRLSLIDCPELKALPDGIEHLRTLEELYMRGASKELTEELRRKEDPNYASKYLTKISHIRRVTVFP